jgi:hypothetical protein
LYRTLIIVRGHSLKSHAVKAHTRLVSMDCEVKQVTSQELKDSVKRIGQLYPILTDCYGNIVDGKHRFNVDEKWKKIKLAQIKTEEERLVARIISNNVRRTVSRGEKTELLRRLGQIYFNEGIGPGKIAQAVAYKTGMSYRWVTKYMPKNFKDNLQSERASSAARHTPGILDQFLKPPRREGALRIKNYANTDFVSLMLDRDFYEEFERECQELGVPTEINALKALEEYHEKMKRAIAFKKKVC